MIKNVTDVTHKSRTKDIAEKEINQVRDTLKALEHGFLIALCEHTGVSRTTVTRFKNGGTIGSDKFKLMEVALRDDFFTGIKNA